MVATLELICLVPVVCGCLVLLCRRPQSLRWVVGVGAGLGVLLTVAALLDPAGTVGFGGLLRLDALARVLVAAVAAVGVLSTTESFAHWRDELAIPGPAAALVGRGIVRVRVYFFWQQVFLASLLTAALSGNLGLSWVAIELSTVTSAVLVGFSGGARAIEAAWKYVILCSVGLALALLTTVLLYALAGGDGIAHLDWTSLATVAAHFPQGPSKLAFLFALVGFGTKSGLAPLHTWLPDAHSEAPAPISALLSGVLLVVVLCTLVRVADITALATGPAFPDHLLLGAGLVSVAVATPFLVIQDDLKRLLAYSTIEQIGLVAIGFGLHSRLAVEGAVLQLLVHALTKSGLFFTAGRVARQMGTQRLARLRALGQRAPLLAGALLFGVVTLCGLPPFGMFFSELAIVQGTARANASLGLLLLALLAVIFAGLVFYAGRVVFGQGGTRTSRVGQRGGWLALGAPALLSLVVGLWVPHLVGHTVVAAANLIIGGHAG